MAATDFTLPLHFEDAERQRQVDLDLVAGTTPDKLLQKCRSGAWWELDNVELLSSAYLLVKSFRGLREAQRQALVELMRVAFNENLSKSAPTGLKVTSFVTFGLLTVAEEEVIEAENVVSRRTAGAGESRQGTPIAKRWTWETEGRETLLRCIVRAVEDRSIWGSSGVPEDYGSSVWRAALAVMDSPKAAKKACVMECICRVITVAGTRWSQGMAVRAALMHSVRKHEHAASAVASLLAWIEEKAGAHGFIDETVDELCCSVSLASDPGIARGLGTTVSSLAALQPTAVARSVRKLIPLLDEESYLLRNGIVDALSHLVLYLGSKTSDAIEKDGVCANGREPIVKSDETIEKSLHLRSELITILFARTRDTHAFTRSRTLQAWARLVTSHVIDVSDFLHLAEAALERLEDKAAAVRRSCLQLWGILLAHNPFAPGLAAAELSAKKEAAEQRNDDVHVRRFEAAARFASIAELAVQRSRTLLRSHSVTDVVEAISLILVSRQFQVDGSEDGCRSMLPLLLSKDRAVSDATTRAFESILFPSSAIGAPRSSAKEEAVSLARSLVLLTRGATVGERVCVEKLVESLATGGGDAEAVLVSPTFVQVLWDVVTGKVGGATSESRRGACSLLSVLGAVRRDRVFLQGDPAGKVAALSSLATQLDDVGLAREACIVLVRVVSTGETAASNNFGAVFAVADEAARSVADNVLRNAATSGSVSNDLWLPLAEQALNVVYSLASTPDVLAARAIEEAARAILVESRAWGIARLVFLIGQAAVKQMVHNEMLAKKSGRQGRSQEQKIDPEEDRDDAGLEEVMGGTQATEIEAAIERGEEELVSQSSFLGSFAPLVARVAMDQNGSNAQRVAAATALAKLMAVHADMCARYIQVMFSLLGDASVPAAVRANTVIALGDLAFRYPNILEPWSSRLYLALRDPVLQVRRNAISTLAHLILNDMIKVRGHIVELVLSLQDDDPRVVEIAKLFFHELSQKGGNLIYNILPDTVSCLSQRENVDRDTYREVMKFLVSFLDKGRHAEGMVDKLCPRFRASDKPRDWQDIAFVLSILPFNDRALQRLVDGFRSYADKLGDEEVFQSFSTIISRSRQMSKVVDKSTVAELEATVQRARAVGEKDDLHEVLRDLSIGGASKTPSQDAKAPQSVRAKRKNLAAMHGGGAEASGQMQLTESPNSTPLHVDR